MEFLIELVSYSKRELLKCLEVNNEELEEILKVLDKKKIIKRNNDKFQFVYVGVAIVKNKPIFLLPKYINIKNKDNQKLHLKKIIELLNEFTLRERLDENNIESIVFNEEKEENEFLSIIKFILDDYSEYGIYENEIEAIELNGNGEINWDKTIEQIDPMVFNKQWIYADFITNKSIVDENKFITLIHGTILNECINILKKYHLDLFINCNEAVVENTLESLDEEDIEVLENEIDKEITVQFNDRKRRVLYAMKSYLNRRCDIGESDLILFGTRNFKWIWEVICGYVFKNEFVNNGKNSKYEVFNITPPKWNINGSNVGNKDTTDLEMKKNRLTPDILRTIILPEGKKLLILDAKYYNIRFDLELGKVLGNPGIEDITKQYLYKVALKTYISKNTIGNDVFNAFLFPTMEPSNVQGYVKLDFMDEYCSDGIKLIMLNVEEIIDKYCNNVTYEMKDIQGFILN